MGRRRIYNTDEERLNANRENKRKSYHKHKENNRDKFRFRSLRNYYLNKLKKIEDQSQTMDTDGVRRDHNVNPKEMDSIMRKIHELDVKIESLTNPKN